MSEPVMIFKVYADPKDCSDMRCPYGGVTFIPFTATVESPLVSGKTLPGACDVQVENPAGSRNMCAKYMFEGTDSAGNKCRLFVENNGYLAEVMRNDPYFHAYPKFMTDSPVLGEYLSQQRFRSEVQGRDWGVEIRIYDVLKEKSESAE